MESGISSLVGIACSGTKEAAPLRLGRESMLSVVWSVILLLQLYASSRLWIRTEKIDNGLCNLTARI